MYILIVAGVLTNPDPTARASSGFTIGADLGAAFYNQGTLVGLGVNVYPGFHFSSGWIPELQIGFSFHQGEPSASAPDMVRQGERAVPASLDQVDQYSLPLLLGLRYLFPSFWEPLTPFVGAHVGGIVTFTHSNIEINGVERNERYIEAGFTFNVGTGVDWFFSNETGVGLVFWWSTVVGGTPRNPYSSDFYFVFYPAVDFRHSWL